MSAQATIRFVDREFLVDFGPESPFRDFATPFRLFGMVEIRETPAGTSVRWDPEEVDPLTLERAITAVEKAQTPIRFDWFKVAWFTETHEFATHAVKRMRAIAQYCGTDLLPTTITRPISDSPIRGRLDDLQRDYMRFSKHISVSTYDERSNSLPVVHCGVHSVMARLTGPGSDNLTDRWRDFAENRRFDNHMARQYEGMLSSGKGRVDHVVAPVMTPYCAEPIWYSYRRAAVPVHHDGEHAVAVICSPGPVNIEMLGWSGSR